MSIKLLYFETILTYLTYIVFFFILNIEINIACIRPYPHFSVISADMSHIRILDGPLFTRDTRDTYPNGRQLMQFRKGARGNRASSVGLLGLIMPRATCTQSKRRPLLNSCRNKSKVILSLCQTIENICTCRLIIVITCIRIETLFFSRHRCKQVSFGI